MNDIVYPNVPFELEPSRLVIGRRGSEAHGTWIPPADNFGVDDRDLIGVLIPPVSYYLGLSHWESAEGINGPWDVVLYEFRKFIHLLLKQNPNVTSLLWLLPEDYLYEHPLFNRLLENRLKFASREAAYTSFVGYAAGQLHRMTHFGTTKRYLGAKRRELEERFGYDCKNAAHLIRLLHMGTEYLRDGVMRVRRTWDRELLVQVKTGQWKLEQVKEYAESWFPKIKDARAHSALPEKPDLETIERMTIDVIRDFRMGKSGDTSGDATR